MPVPELSNITFPHGTATETLGNAKTEYHRFLTMAQSNEPVQTPPQYYHDVVRKSAALPGGVHGLAGWVAFPFLLLLTLR